MYSLRPVPYHTNRDIHDREEIVFLASPYTPLEFTEHTARKRRVIKRRPGEREGESKEGLKKYIWLGAEDALASQGED